MHILTDVAQGIFMPEIILVVSASAKGSTPEIAQAIGNVLQEAGYTVDVEDVKHIVSLEGCTAIVLGIPLYSLFSGKDDFSSFKQQFGADLAKLPIAAFGAGLIYDGLKRDRVKYLGTALKKNLFPLQPVATVFFVGTLKHENQNVIGRDKNVALNAVAPFHDENKIRNFAQALPSQLGLHPSGVCFRSAGTHTGDI
jgi:menaquinone-dependent protoporphyrinogen IX oxidase